MLHKTTPDVGFLGEEEGAASWGGAGLLWALDPVDGTVNLVRGLPLCAVALGLFEQGRPVLGVIDLPFLETRYHAAVGEGAFSNGRRLQLGRSRPLDEAIVALGDYAVGDESERRNQLRLDVAEQLANRALRVRMLGSAAIDLVWLAEGRLDAMVTLSNKPWDMAAGVVVASEAGASVVDVDGAPYRATSRATLAAAEPLIHEIVQLVRAAPHFPGGL